MKDAGNGSPVVHPWVSSSSRNGATLPGPVLRDTPYQPVDYSSVPSCRAYLSKRCSISLLLTGVVCKEGLPIYLPQEPGLKSPSPTNPTTN